MKLITASANCGNSTLGESACQRFTGYLTTQQAEVVIIHCQEVSLKKTLQQLTPYTDKAGLKVMASPLRVTRTKLFNTDVLLGRTGMATLVIYNPKTLKAVEFNPPSRTVVKGSGWFSGFNKGALIERLTLKTASQGDFSVRSVCGHLDAYNANHRASEWAKIKQATTCQGTSWQQLVEHVVDVQVAGYDTNTRNRYLSKNRLAATNPWEQSALDPTITPLYSAPLGPTLYSARNTFSPTKVRRPDPKRKGEETAGSLDFVAIQNNTHPSHQAPPTPYRYHKGIVHPPEHNTQRDHAIIVSPPVTLKKVSPFIRVRNHLALELKNAAPALAKDILKLVESTDHQQLLVKIYQHYFGTNGALLARLKSAVPKAAEQPVSTWFPADRLSAYQSKTPSSPLKPNAPPPAPPSNFSSPLASSPSPDTSAVTRIARCKRSP